METKFCQIKADVTDEGVISGYASKFNMVDLGGDTIAPGAYKSSLTKRQPVMLWQHRPDQPIGVWEAKEDGEGLWVEGRIATNSTLGRDAYELAKIGAVKGLSIGYSVTQKEKRGNGRILKGVDLFEVSLVTFPMQQEAQLSDVKAEGLHQLKRDVERLARDAGFSAWQAKAAAADFAAKLGDGSRDAAAEEVFEAMKASFKL